MTSKERVRRTFNHERTDRVPFDYNDNPGVNRRMKDHLGLAPTDQEGLLQALDVDIRGKTAAYRGPELHQQKPGRKVQPEWGYIMRWVDNEYGGYWDFCDFPLEHADEETIATWPMPSPDDFDYEGLVDSCKQHPEHGLYLGDAGLGCVINTAGFFRGMEQVFVDLALDDAAGLLLIDRFLGIQLICLERSLEKVSNRVDFIWMGEDLGTQLGPIIGRDTFLKHILPRQKPFLELAKAYGIPVMFHTCGSSSWSYEDYILAGVKAVDTLQPEAFNMSPAYLKRQFGGRLAFHGCISTTGNLANGTPDDVGREVQEVLSIMMPGGGYFLSPTHQIQDNSSVENVLAIYGAGRKYGRY